MTTAPNRSTVALTAAAMTAFAANSLLCRAALGEGRLDAITFTTVRVVSGAAALVIIAGRARAPRPRGTWLSALALFGYAFGFSLAYLRIPAGVGALVLFGAVQGTMIGAALAGGARLLPGEWLGLGMALVGLVVLTSPGLAAPDLGGALLMAAAGAAWGAYSLRGRGNGNPLSITAGNFVLASGPALVTTLVAAPFGTLHWTTLGVVMAVVSGAVTSGVGYVIWYAALRGLTATQAAIVQLVVPLLTAAGGAILLGEAFGLRLLLSALLVLGGILLTVLVRAAR